MLIFLFGEVDCRTHFYRHSMEMNVSITNLINNTTDRYIEVVNRSRDIKHKTVGIHGITPAARQDNLFKLKHYADEQTRRKINEDFNALMIEKCAANDIPYLDVMSMPRVVAEDGLINLEVAPDCVHLSPKEYPELGIRFFEWIKNDVRR